MSGGKTGSSPSGSREQTGARLYRFLRRARLRFEFCQESVTRDALTQRPFRATSPEMPAHLLIGLDDTDTAETRGTGFLARRLGMHLGTVGLATVDGITRHQLLVDPRIRYTTHNSAACLSARAPAGTLEALATACRRFLRAESAPGADAGLCLIPFERAAVPIQEFGARAKVELLQPGEAHRLGRDLILEGLTGDGGGVIGALAAVALHAAGWDGRFLWLPGLREAAGRRYRLADLAAATGIERVQATDGTPIDRDEVTVDLGSWPRPVLQDGRAVLLVEKVNDDAADCWRAAPRAVVKRY